MGKFVTTTTTSSENIGGSKPAVGKFERDLSKLGVDMIRK